MERNESVCPLTIPSHQIYHLGSTHQNHDIYPNPEQWDPSRYFPERAEDKKVQYGYAGWGLGRHPCLGMRFAKLEMNVITAHFLATFDEYHLCDRAGEAVRGLPRVDVQGHAASKPSRPVYLKVHRREK
jgi:cytochrome P450